MRDLEELERRIGAGLGSSEEQLINAARDAAGHLRARCEAAEAAERRLVCRIAREEAASLLHEFDGFQRALRAVMAIIEARAKSSTSSARSNEAREILDELSALYRRRA